jgi:uncharacterized alpha-E superfamily protein
MLSRVANSLYWMNRYLERADNTARLVDVNLQLLLDHRALDERTLAGHWIPIVQSAGDEKLFLSLHTRATGKTVTEFLVFQPENTNSILAAVTQARENARMVRDQITSEVWEEINRLYLFLRSPAARQLLDSSPIEFFQEIKASSLYLQGLTNATVLRNEGWLFQQAGKYLERADKTSRILDVKYFILLPSVRDVGTPYDDVQWSAVLKSVSGFEMYRKRHGRIAPDRIVEFLLLDHEFPRALRYCIGRADRSLHVITGSSADSFSCGSEQWLGLLRSELDFTRVETILTAGLHEFCDALQTKMNTIDECVNRDFFGPTPVG